MKKMMQKFVTSGVVGLSILACSALAHADEHTATLPATADQAIERLLEGNAKYIKGEFDKLSSASQPSDRTTVAAGQKPYAIIVTCSDSRVPPEILFNQGLGEIFVIRVAGNVVAPHEMGSIEYAVEHIGTPKVIMVLGHERCGAVTAAVGAHGTTVEGNIGSLIDSIAPAVNTAMAENPTLTGAALVEAACDVNVENVEREIEESPVIFEAVEAGKVEIVGAKYDLDNGKVTLLSH